MKRATETDLVRSVLVYLQIQYPDGFWFRQNTGAAVSEYKGRKRLIRYGVPGMADIQGILDGRAIFIECKTDTGKQSPSQKAFEASVTRAGALYRLVRDLDDLRGLR